MGGVGRLAFVALVISVGACSFFTDRAILQESRLLVSDVSGGHSLTKRTLTIGASRGRITWALEVEVSLNWTCRRSGTLTPQTYLRLWREFERLGDADPGALWPHRESIVAEGLRAVFEAADGSETGALLDAELRREFAWRPLHLGYYVVWGSAGGQDAGFVKAGIFDHESSASPIYADVYLAVSDFEEAGDAWEECLAAEKERFTVDRKQDEAAIDPFATRPP